MRSAMPVAAEPAPRNMILQIREPQAGDAGRRVHAGQGDGGRALDVVVEAQHALPVLVQQRVRVGRQEILELDQRIGIARLHGGHELVDEIEIAPSLRAACADTRGTAGRSAVPRCSCRRRASPAGTTPDRCRRTRCRAPASRSGCPCRWRPRSPRPRIRCPSVTTMTRMSLRGQLAEDAPDRAAIVRGDEEALRLSRDVRELPAGLADRGRVDERQDPIDVRDRRSGRTAARSAPAATTAACSDRCREAAARRLAITRSHHLPVGRDAVRQQSSQTETIPVAAGRTRSIG